MSSSREIKKKCLGSYDEILSVSAKREEKPTCRARPDLDRCRRTGFFLSWDRGTDVEKSNPGVGAERIGKVAGCVQRDVRGIVESNTSAAGMKTGVEALKESVSQGTGAVEEKAGKTEKLLRLISNRRDSRQRNTRFDRQVLVMKAGYVNIPPPEIS